MQLRDLLVSTPIDDQLSSLPFQLQFSDQHPDHQKDIQQKRAMLSSQGFQSRDGTLGHDEDMQRI